MTSPDFPTGTTVKKKKKHTPPDLSYDNDKGKKREAPDHGSVRWWATKVLQNLGAPTSGSNINFLVAWASREGGHWGNSAAYNPLCTTLDKPGAGSMNSVGVKVYTSWAQGIEATADTIRLGTYSDILHDLNHSTATPHTHYASLMSWSGNAYDNLSGGSTSYNPTGSGAGGGDGGTGYDSPGGGGDGVKLSKSDLAARYGFAASFLDDHEGIERLIARAAKEGWDDDTFWGHFRETKFYKRHDDEQRKFLLLQSQDPATFKHKLEVRTHDIRQQAKALGLNLTDDEVAGFAQRSLYNGMDDNQIAQGLARHLEFKKGKEQGGAAGTTEDGLRQVAMDYGLSLSDHSTFQWMKRLLTGRVGEDNYLQHVQELAKSAFPALTKQIDQGKTVREAADPYVEAMSQVLELNPTAVDFSRDPLIRQAFSYTTKDGGEPGLMPLWQFQQTVKEDPRWLHTNNARDDLMGVTTGILQDWGVL